MKKLLIGTSGLLVVLLGGLFVVPSLIPSSVYKDKIQTQLSSELGREVRISGDVKLSTFPLIKAKTGAVEIDNPEGFSRTEFAKLNGLEARVKLLPLLSKRVEISRFTLEEPVIHLEKKTDGSTNWTMGDETTPAKEEKTGPFRRDGRMATFDPQISAFTLENGTITYKDAAKGTELSITDINTFVSLPSMSKTLVVDGSLTYDGTPVTLDMSLNSPRSFLDGQSASIKGNAKTDFANFDIDGEFLPGEAIAMAAKLDGNISDMSAIKPYLGANAQYLAPVSQTDFSGNFRYEGKTISAKAADIKVSGDTLNVTYKGDALYNGTPSATGDLKVDVSDISVLKPYIPEGFKGLEHLQTIKLNAALKAKDKGFTAETLSANLAGPDIDANFTGTASYEDFIKADGAFTANLPNPAKLAASFAPDVKSVAALGATKFSGKLALNDKDVWVQALNITTDGENLKGSYDGNLAFRDGQPTAEGSFTANISDIPALANTAAMKIDNIGAVKSVAATGTVNYTAGTANLSNIDAKLTNGALNGSYKGAVATGELPSFDGEFTANIAQLSALNNVVTMEVPYADAIGKIDVTGKVKGAGQAIDITGLTAALSDGMMNGSYNGSAQYNNGLSLNGILDATIPSLRDLAQSTGTILPPNTSAGEIFERVALKGDVSGTPERIDLKNADLSFDKMKGSGTFGVDLTSPKPTLTGVLNVTPGLDLRPYMESYSAQRPQGEIQPWSEEPINTAALKAVDANVKINTPFIKTGRLNTEATTIDTKLTNGKLTANMPDLSLYGGVGTLTASLDASGTVPAIAVDANLDRLKTDSFLAAVAGFTKASGDGTTLFKIRGQGQSQAAIMRSLNGDGGYEVTNGSLQGIDVTEFMTGLETALTSRSLPSGIGAAEITQFQNLIGKFTIENGVVKIGTFNLKGLNMLAEGDGEIDLGNQTIDFRLLPKLTGEQASGLAAFGIPIRFSGGFGSAKASLDTQFLGEIAAARAQAEVQKKLKDQVGGALGGLLGGGTSKTPTDSDTSTETPEQGGATPKPTEKDVLEDALGGLFGGKKTTPKEPATTEPAPVEANQDEAKTEEKAKEPTLEDALGGLFGKKKKKDD